jgi:predicted ribosome quality control (RQC) complex YloA/Tae2 family protein
LLKHQELDLDNLELLKAGRHFRIGKNTRFVVGRNEFENNLLTRLAKPGDYLFHPQNDLAGPVSLARGLISLELLDLCSQITAAYSDTAEAGEINVFYRHLPEAEEKARKALCMPKSNFAHLLIPQ